MEGKKSFIAYCDWGEIFNSLPDDKAGQLAKHLFKYVSDKDPKTNDVLINAVFSGIRTQLKRDLDKWETQQAQRIEAGKKSAAIRKRNSTPVNDRSISSTVNGIVTVNVNDTVNVNVNDIKKEVKKERAYGVAVHTCLENCLSFFPEHLLPKNKKENSAALETIDKLQRIDKLDPKQIEMLVKWARSDQFWAKNFLTINKLRKRNKDGIMYAVVFFENIKSISLSIKNNDGINDPIEVRKARLANHFREKYG